VVERVRRRVQWRRRFKCKLPGFVAFGPCDTGAAPRSNNARTMHLDPGYRSIIDFWFRDKVKNMLKASSHPTIMANTVSLQPCAAP
jgi:hypothetical protein